MPVNPAELLTLQAGLFLLLLLAVSAWDLKWRIIPDSLQLAIAALTFLCFSPGNLLGIFGALPYLVIALFFGGMDGMGGGDIKLAASTGVVLGLPSSLTASMLGLGGFVIYSTIYMKLRRLHGQKDKIAFPVGPFLAAGSAATYFMKIGGYIV
nr:prepilin peptidase [uncultured Eisenbergiella sp.]